MLAGDADVEDSNSKGKQCDTKNETWMKIMRETGIEDCLDRRKMTTSSTSQSSKDASSHSVQHSSDSSMWGKAFTICTAELQ